MTKASGAQRLREWMKKNEKTQKQFGDLVGARQPSVSTWLLGRPPSLPYALRIRDLTGIPIECWDSTYVTARSARRAWGNKGLPLGRAKHLALAKSGKVPAMKEDGSLHD